ncbi:flagellin N-terminal helical domain-containing protein [Jiella marina]|uniref:flagellin N-terminal helical domain-containing protein n=1 Tax=Jiella sp. LLJ827 TaxID=2917712 RepID=UPI002100F7AA|nr:flagellin [Jiella sp. LLJ827]MCQ0989832.1 hypothetical protein [Jiella sp. LLJ827]
MISLHTNISTMTGLAALRATQDSLVATQETMSSGYRVSGARDDATYWSVATTMRVDLDSIGAVQDALGLGASMVDTAYDGMSAVEGVVSRVKSLIVSAQDSSVDREALQKEIAEAQSAIASIAEAASFAGVNWLDTNIDDLHEADASKRISLVPASIVRGSDGRIDLSTIGLDISEVSLFNGDGGGILQAEERSPKTIGGLRFVSASTETGYTTDGPFRAAVGAHQDFAFDGPVTFGTGDTMSFTLTLGAEDSGDPALPPPYEPGVPLHVVIDRALVDSVLPSAGGVIDTRDDFVDVLRVAVGAPVWVMPREETDSDGEVTEFIRLVDRELSGTDGASMRVSNFTTTTATSGGLGNTGIHYGQTGSSLTVDFEPFRVYRGMVISFDFTSYTNLRSFVIDRATVNEALGKDDGMVQTSEDMVMVLDSIMGAIPNLSIETEGDDFKFVMDRAANRDAASGSGIFVSAVEVSSGPLYDFGILDIDVAAKPEMIESYLTVVDKMHRDVSTAAARLGALKERIAMQDSFLDGLSNTLRGGIAQLVDADMEEESARLRALQAREELGLQALSLTNTSDRAIRQLFAA